jgi:hypothetical protein
MIGKGNLHPHGIKLARYMTENGRVPVIDKRGFLATDLGEAFATIQAIAESQTRCENPFFHVYIRLPQGENLNPEQWLDAADRFEDRLGFSGQPRAVVIHQDKHGDHHMHAVWSRIDTDTMRALDPGLYKNKMKELCRELEVEYGLTRVSSERREDRQTLAAARSEFDQARRLGTDLAAIRETIRDCYDHSDSGPSFQAALGEYDLTLARGDERDFVVVDSARGLHALGKRICGVTLAEVRKKIGPVTTRSLPTVAEVRERLAERAPGRPELPEASGARSKPRRRKGHRGMDEPLTDDLLKKQPQREADQLAVAKALKEQLTAFEQRKQQEADEAKKAEQQRRRADEQRAAEGHETDAKSRYAQALGQHYDIRDPYASLARAAMAEYGQFHRQRENLKKDAERQKDPGKKAEIELRMKIEACDYMALTSERLAGISAVIGGREDAPQANADRERAKYWQDEAVKARDQRAQLMQVRQTGQQRQEPAQDRGQGTDRNRQTGDETRSGANESQTDKRPALPEKEVGRGHAGQGGATVVGNAIHTRTAAQRLEAEARLAAGQQDQAEATNIPKELRSSETNDARSLASETGASRSQDRKAQETRVRGTERPATTGPARSPTGGGRGGR